MSNSEVMQIRETRAVVDPTESIDFYQIHLQLARQLEVREGDAAEAVLRGILTLLGGETICFEERRAAGDAVRRWVNRHEHSPWQEAMEGEAEEQLGETAGASRTRLHPCAFRENLFVLAAPLRLMGRHAGGVVVFLEAPSESELQPFVAIFQAALGFLAGALLLGDLRGAEADVRDSAAWIEMSGRALRAPYPERGLQQLLDDFKAVLGAAHVAAGTVRRGRPEIRGLAGLVHLERKGSLVSLMEACLVEIRRAGRVELRSGEAAGGMPGETPALYEVCRSVPGSSALGLSLPLGEETEGRWVLLVLWAAPEVPVRARRFLEAVRPECGAVLAAVEHSDPLRMRKWTHLAWTRLEPRKRLWVKCAVAAVLGLCLLPVPTRISAEARLEPTLRRVVSARYEGTLLEAHVRPGDLVEAGQLLARMDDMELLLREAEMVASRERAERRRDLAMTDPGTPVAAARMAQLELEALDLDLALLAERKASLELRAPIDGMVMAGDLDRVIGVPVQSGQTLFELAPPGAMRVEMLVPAHEIARVETGMAVRVRLQSFPGREWESRVTRIAPRSDQTRGNNVFVVEAVLEAPEEEVSPFRAGMAGRASLRGRRVPLAWSLLRRLVDFVRVTLFW